MSRLIDRGWVEYDKGRMNLRLVRTTETLAIARTAGELGPVRRVPRNRMTRIRSNPGWGIYRTDRKTMHVMPLDDKLVHCSTEACKCKPRQELTYNGMTMVVHNSWDGREIVERAEVAAVGSRN